MTIIINAYQLLYYHNYQIVYLKKKIEREKSYFVELIPFRINLLNLQLYGHTTTMSFFFFLRRTNNEF